MMLSDTYISQRSSIVVAVTTVSAIGVACYWWHRAQRSKDAAASRGAADTVELKKGASEQSTCCDHSRGAATLPTADADTDSSTDEHSSHVPEPPKYFWTQDRDEVTFEMSVPPETTSRDVGVDFESHRIGVRVHGHEVFAGATARMIRPDESTWTLDGKGDSRRLVVTLAKCTLDGKPMWYSLIRGHADMWDSCDPAARVPGS